MVAEPKPVGAPAQRIVVQIENRRLVVSNLDKVLYPADGFTKAEMINYYSTVAPLMIPHLRDRPVTVVRWPNGVQGSQHWFGKNVPSDAPEWPRTVLPGSGSRVSGDPVRYPLMDNLPGLVWLANLAALEVHVPQWTVDRKGRSSTTRPTPTGCCPDMTRRSGSTRAWCPGLTTHLAPVD